MFLLAQREKREIAHSQQVGRRGGGGHLASLPEGMLTTGTGVPSLDSPFYLSPSNALAWPRITTAARGTTARAVPVIQKSISLSESARPAFGVNKCPPARRRHSVRRDSLPEHSAHSLIRRHGFGRVNDVSAGLALTTPVTRKSPAEAGHEA